MTQPTPTTSRSVAASSGVSGKPGQPTRTGHPSEVKPRLHDLPPSATTKRHWLEGLEPYEGKLSSTVLRGGRAGNSPLPLDLKIFFERRTGESSRPDQT